MCTLILVVLVCSRFGELALRSVAACRDQARGVEGLLQRARREEGRRPGRDQEGVLRGIARYNWVWHLYCNLWLV